MSEVSEQASEASATKWSAAKTVSGVREATEWPVKNAIVCD